MHVRTRKGAGYAPAEATADKYHAVTKFDVVTGAQSKPVAKAPSYTGVFAKALIAEAEVDKKIVVITGAMPSGTGVDAFEKRFPDRAFDVGIAEQHAVTFAAGLASEGMRPFAAILFRITFLGNFARVLLSGCGAFAMQFEMSR